MILLRDSIVGFLFFVLHMMKRQQCGDEWIAKFFRFERMGNRCELTNLIAQA